MALSGRYREDGTIRCPQCDGVAIDMNNLPIAPIPPTPNSPQNTFVSLKKTDQYKKDVALIRQRKRAVADSTKPMRQVLNSVKQEFVGRTLPHVQAIRDAKKELNTRLISSAEWKTWLSATRSLKRSTTTILDRYASLSGEEWRKSFGALSRYRYRYYDSWYLLRRTFRIRL